MFDLPPELALGILSYLPLGSLVSLQAVCKHWDRFCKTNESVIYHNASVHHDYIGSPAVSIEEACLMYSKRAIGSVSVLDWKSFCKKRKYIENSWSGKAPSSITPHYSTGKDVHRFKIDEAAGYIISTTSRGGIFVNDLSTDEELWSLPTTYVRQYAHCEYGNGYIVFDHVEGTKEVWRRAVDYTDDEAACIAPCSKPALRQLAAAAGNYSPATTPDASTSEIESTPAPQRGHFCPWALIRPPDTTRAFRLSYPILGSTSQNTIQLWDVRTGALVQQIDEIQQIAPDDDPNDRLGVISYIEVGEKYVFVCGHLALRVFERGENGTGRVKGTGGRGRCVMSMSPHYSVRWRLKVDRDVELRGVDGANVVGYQVEENQIMPDTPDLHGDYLGAVHVSSCGLHLAVLAHTAQVVLIPNFEDLFFGKGTSLAQRAIEIDFNYRDTSLYLAFENGRVATATTAGIFIIEPDWSHVAFTTALDGNAACNMNPPPKVSVQHVQALEDILCLETVSCLQMTDTGLFINWSPSELGSSRPSVLPSGFEGVISTVVSVDFMEPYSMSALSGESMVVLCPSAL